MAFSGLHLGTTLGLAFLIMVGGAAPPEGAAPKSDQPRVEESSDSTEPPSSAPDAGEEESKPDRAPAESSNHAGTDAPRSDEATATMGRSGTATAPATTTATSAEDPTATAPVDEGVEFDTPQVELYIPSVAGLIDAAKKSRTAEIYRALVGMIPPLEDEAGEGVDLEAVMALFEQLRGWPDTSLAATVYTQDRDGRARWAVRLDWPPAELRSRLEALLNQEAAGKLLEDVELGETDGGRCRIELPDYVLAVLLESGEGSLIASSADLRVPGAIFGQQPSGGGTGTTQAAASATSPKKKAKKRSLLYCRFNLEAAGAELEGSSYSMVKDIRYALSLRKSGLWSERFAVRSPELGIGNKVAGVMAMLSPEGGISLAKVGQPFECPRESYAALALGLRLPDGMANSIAGLPPKTIGRRAGLAMAFSAVPGSGFLPWPDFFYQFKVIGKDRVVKAIRQALEKDAEKRRARDREPAWHEEEIGEGVVFWHGPLAEGASVISPVTYRTVLFFQETRSEADSSSWRLIIAQTTGWADDAVARWGELMKSRKQRVTIPSSKKAHWQARISWKKIYDLAHPYLSLAAGLTEDATLPPPAEELDDALADAVINVRIEFSGFQVRHKGPIPIGAAYVPAVMYAALGAAGDPSSEASRQQVACRHLRVLYHHAKLFEKDYGRWPATVAELDGYIDFATHAHLLKLRPMERGFVAGLVSIFTGDKQDDQEEDDEIDDSLYVIDWSPEDWRLRLRDGEFKNYATIYIDRDGEIHRVPKTESGPPDDAEAPDADQRL